MTLNIFSRRNHDRRQSVKRAAGAYAMAAMLSITLAACSNESPSQGDGAGSPSASQDASGDILADHNLAGKDAKTIITELDTMAVADRPTNLMASIRPTELVVANDLGDQISVPLPANEFYLSIAPYVNQTHECHFHSLTTCLGEMANAQIHLTIVDKGTGEAIVDEDTTTFDNGFIGVWIPKGIDATVTITADGKTATTDVSTLAEDDATCLTTMQLL